MPQLIQSIDQIARQRQRDTLFLAFNNNAARICSNTERRDAIDWLNSKAIPFEPCGLIASEYKIQPDQGHLYVDVPYDSDNHRFKQLIAHFEHEDGTRKAPNTVIYILSLEDALKNKHHDEEGFWEKWAEDF